MAVPAVLPGGDHQDEVVSAIAVARARPRRYISMS
jgi:hypothetical protein